MERAVAACGQALLDYQSGLLDEDQLRHALYRDGLVVGDDELWLLDVAEGAWRRYDGVSTEQIPADGRAGGPTHRAFDAATLRRWHEGLRALQAAAPSEGAATGG